MEIASSSVSGDDEEATQPNSTTMKHTYPETLFNSQKCSNSLRITCYGSSSSDTPSKYLNESRLMGYTLARRGHICVNGAGMSGCMGALNDGAVDGNGFIIGVIHKMFVVDESDDDLDGAHPVFARDRKKKKDGVRAKIYLAGGDDLQERKRLLVEGTDGLVVLPGGPGTWDELWEMACARNVGLSSLPIVCVNVDGFYDPFLSMLERAYLENLTRHKPSDLVHFESTSESAVQWLEEQIQMNKKNSDKKKVKLRKSIDPNYWSFYTIQKSWLEQSFSWLSQSFQTDTNDSTNDNDNDGSLGLLVIQFAGTLATGILIGMFVSQAKWNMK